MGKLKAWKKQKSIIYSHNCETVACKACMVDNDKTMNCKQNYKKGDMKMSSELPTRILN